MPSAEHESPVELTRMDPDLAAWLLTNLFHVKVPDYDHARTHATDVRVMVPRTYHADCMVLFCDQADRPLMAAVIEVQRGWDPTKRRAWKLYVAQLEAELNVDAALLVYGTDPAVTRRYRTLFEGDGLCLSLRPLIFTPDDIPLVVDVAIARTSPALAVLSTICHGDRADLESAFPALAAALHAADPTETLRYYDIVLAGLPMAARVRWEEFMTTSAEYEFRSDLLRNAHAQGQAEGEARAILTVLQGRGVAVPDEVRDRVLECTDTAQLTTWLQRAATATTTDDVLRE